MPRVELFLITLLCLMWLPIAGAQPLGVASSSNARTEASFTKLNLETFDEVWSTVADRTWNEDFDRAAWEAAKTEFRPRVEAATKISQVRGILEQLIARLHLSHYSIIPGDIYSDFENTTDGAENISGESGISVRIIDEAACVTEVAQESDAFAQGVRRGWQLVTVRGKEVAKFVSGLEQSLGKRSAYRAETLAALMIEARLSGGLGEAISLSCLDETGSARDVEIKLHLPAGEKVKFGYLPTMFVRAEGKEVEPGIGYMRFNTFFAPTRVMQALSTAIEVGEQGLVLDLRGNVGGLAGMTMGIGNRVISEEKQFLGIHKMKETELKYVLIPGANPYEGPLALLVDECSISSAEILAGGLQAIGRARVFGSTSAGAALPSMVTELPNGDFFQFAIADFVDANGKHIEGTGVVPDEPVDLALSDLIEDRDPALEAAIAWLRSTPGD